MKSPSSASKAAPRQINKKSWQIYDGKTCASVITINNRIVSAPPEFQRFVGQLLATLPRRMKTVPVVTPDG